MKTLIALFVCGYSVFGAAAPESPVLPHPPKDTAALADYWRAIAAHHAQSAAYQSSVNSVQKQLSDAIGQQKQLLESLTQIDREIEAREQKLCAEDELLDKSGPAPLCRAKPKEAGKEPGKEPVKEPENAAKKAATK